MTFDESRLLAVHMHEHDITAWMEHLGGDDYAVGFLWNGRFLRVDEKK